MDNTTKKPWQSPNVAEVGHVGNVVRGGNGKLSTTGGDPGEALKPPGNGQ